MELEGICFNRNIILTGAFQLSDGASYFGKLFYRKNEQCNFLLYMDSFNVKEYQYKEITAKLSDENETIYCVNLFNCRLEHAAITTVGNSFTGYFDYALFSKQRHFDSRKDNINDKINIFINTWAEFCFPQGYKPYAEFQLQMSEFRLKNKMKISFNQDINGRYINENHIFNQLFINWKLSETDINNIEQQLNQILIPHKQNMVIKIAEKHKWYIRIENIPQKLNINLVSYYLNAMLMCFTHDFGSKIDKIEIISKDIIKNSLVSTKFDYLYSSNIITIEPKYHYRISAFNFNTFNDKEWQTILDNLFSKIKIIEPFFDILYQNYYEKKLSEYHLERYIDCIAAIGNNKNYGKTKKYENVLQDFALNLDKNSQKQLLNIFRTSLKNIKTKNDKNAKNKQKRNWGLIGKKLCELRAMTTHFNDTSKRVDIGKYIILYYIIELIIIDYIFEILDIDSKKRLEYKNFYIKHFIST